MVDDGLAACKDIVQISAMISYLQEHFEVTSGPVEVYVGMRITRDRFSRRLWIDQTRFIHTMLAKYGFSDAHPVLTPADVNVHLQSPLIHDDTPIPDFPYENMVGCLLYVSCITRLDISLATTTVSQYNNNYQEIHCTAVRRIMKYLLGTADFGICYSGSSTPTILTTYADANYAGDIDDRKSQTGCILMLNGGSISWLSCKQQCTASSTTESEYIAAATSSKETKWQRCLLFEMGHLQHLPTKLYGDNQATLQLVLNPEYHKRTKHIDVAYHVIREHQQRGIVNVTYVNTHHQLADILTKPLPPDKFCKLRTSLNLIKISQD